LHFVLILTEAALRALGMGILNWPALG
jgi:hypothetical protein